VAQVEVQGVVPTLMLVQGSLLSQLLLNQLREVFH
jgi:hypothetical protein